jgi:hypothetical protein
MQIEVDIKLLNTLNNDVIINNIIPYTYKPQPKKLLFDIKNFYSEFSIIENSYTYDYNYYILLFDLISFCNNNDPLIFTLHDRFENILKRNYSLSTCNYSHLNNFSFDNFNKNLQININRKIRFIWGLLRPVERVKFINKYLLEY